MANHGKRSQEGQYVPLPYAVLKSAAWRSLGGAAVKLFFELHIRFHGGNNGRLHLSMNEAVGALGLGKATVKRAFDELQEKGFIDLVTPGNFYHRRAHEWRLTTKAMQTTKGKQAASNDWKSWRQKTKRGSVADPSGCSRVPRQNPKPSHGSKSKPVRAVSGARFGSGMEH